MARTRMVSAVLAGVLLAGLLSAAVPSAAATHICARDVVAAEALPAEVSPATCDLRGATITSDGLRLQVPPRGQGRSIVGLTTTGEVALQVSTSADGVVAIATGELHADDPAPAPYTAAQVSDVVAGSDSFAGAPELAVASSFMPTTGQTFDLGQLTLQPDEPVAGCDSSAVGSLWYRLGRPGTLRRIKLRADVPLALYRGTSLAGLQRAACIPALAPERRVTLASTGTYYLQAAVTQADLTAGKFAAHVWLSNGEMRPDGTPPCDSRAYKLVEDMAPRKPFKWRFHAASTPPSLTRTQALRGIKQGMGIIANARNDCGLADTVSARHAYLGTTSKPASLCLGRGTDGVNSVSFGSAPVGMLGFACSAWSITATGKRHTVESDMRLTKAIEWTMRPDAPSCRQNVDIDLVGVVAHETGHVFGLDHAEGVKGLNQTMSPSSGACNGAARTLGRGDVVALRKLY